MSVFAVPATLYMGSITKTDGTGGSQIIDIDQALLQVDIRVSGRMRMRRSRHYKRPIIHESEATVVVGFQSNGQEGLDRFLSFFADTLQAKANQNDFPGEDPKATRLLIIPEEASSTRLFYSPDVSWDPSNPEVSLFYDRSLGHAEGMVIRLLCCPSTTYATEPAWSYGTAANLASNHTELSVPS